MRKKRTATDALEVMDARFGHLPGWKDGVQQERRKLAVGMLIRESREAQGLTQKQLAQRVGTSQSAISRIEDANYDKLMLETLYRIADALNLPLAIRLGKRSAQLQPA
jgi:ribosome-binding protein aMBF1 (putative translation factor)